MKIPLNLTLLDVIQILGAEIIRVFVLTGIWECSVTLSRGNTTLNQSTFDKTDDIQGLPTANGYCDF